MSDVIDYKINCKMAVENLPVNILIVDKNGYVTFTNKAFEKNFGKGYIKNLDKGPGDLLCCQNSYLSEDGCGHSEECGKCILRNYILDAMRGEGKDQPVEVLLTLMGGYEPEKRWFEVHVMPTFQQSEQYMVCMLDVTIYKKNSFRLLQNKKAADAANKAKSEFLANMSHEIRTPLNGVLGMLELTLLTELSEEQRENLEVAKNCADTLLNLINDVLDLSKVESNRVDLEEKKFDIREMVRKAADTQTAKILEKNLILECNVDEKLPEFFFGDEFRLRQVLNNLLSNAVKFTEKGSVRLEVKRLCSASDSCTVVFTVEDTGIGISQKDLNKLFKPFNQVDGSISRKYGGTGLGLAISQRLVELMGGEIKVKSQPDKGSVFFFTIQLKITDDVEREEAESVFEKAEFNPARILVVEDDRANQMVISQILMKMGYHNVVIASNGFDGLKNLEEESFDLILMDIQLPELDGIDTTRIIREKEKGTKTHIPVIALTAHALKGDREKFLEQGMDAYVAKPVDPRVLRDTLEQMLEKKSGEEYREKELMQAYASWGSRNAIASLGDRSAKGSMGYQEEKLVKQPGSSEKRAYRAILTEVRELLANESRNTDSFIRMEKKIHEMKIMAQQKEYDSIKANAFRLELAARKKDGDKMKKLLDQLDKLLQSGREGRYYEDINCGG